MYYARGGQPAARLPLTTYFMLLNGSLAPDKITYNLTDNTQFFNILYVVFVIVNDTQVLISYSTFLYFFVQYRKRLAILLYYAHTLGSPGIIYPNNRIKYLEVGSDYRSNKLIIIVDL